LDKFPIAASKEKSQLKEKIVTYYTELIYGKNKQKEVKKGKSIRTPDPTTKEILRLKKDIIKFDGEIKLFRERQKTLHKRNISQNGVKVRLDGLFNDNATEVVSVYQKYLDEYNEQLIFGYSRNNPRKFLSTTRKKVSLIKMARMPVELPEVDDVTRVKGLLIKGFKNLKVAGNDIRNTLCSFPKMELLKANKKILQQLPT